MESMKRVASKGGRRDRRVTMEGDEEEVVEKPKPKIKVGGQLHDKR
jgi:hypothetical protein